MQSPPEPEQLVSTIKDLKARIQDHSGYLRGLEMRTRQVLIDPLLRELGWDVERPDQVHLEFHGTGGVPDYALMSDGSPVALIEAKRLGAELESAKDQLIAYAMDSPGVRLVACTNGDEWVFWRKSKGSKRDNVRICADETFKTAYVMVTWLAKANLRGGVDKLESARRSVNGSWHTLGGHMPQGSKPPTAIRFGDGTELQLKHWLDTSMAVARHLFDTGALTRAKVPVRSPRGNRFLVSDSPVHADGKPYRNPKEFADGLWLDGGGGRQWTLKECTELLEACGLESGTVRVRFG